MRWTAISSLTVLAAAGALPAASPAGAACKLQLAAELPVDMSHGVPIATGQLNGATVKVLIDSGASSSQIMRSAASQLGLGGFRLDDEAHSIGGETEVLATQVKSLRIQNLTASNLILLIGGAPRALPGVDLILGDDVLSQYDVEFDLPDNVIRLFHPDGCAPEQLDYWNKPYSQAPLLPSLRDLPSMQTDVMLNGRRFLGELDSGASSSIVDAYAADAAGAKRVGEASNIEGLGPLPRAAWTAHFDSFAYGDEKIGNADLLITDLTSDFKADATAGSTVPRRLDSTPTMLIGADFLRAHRVYVSNKDHVVVFSYNGGPVFRAPK